jgi:hypothetical protein
MMQENVHVTETLKVPIRIASIHAFGLRWLDYELRMARFINPDLDFTLSDLNNYGGRAFPNDRFGREVGIEILW